MNRADSWRYAGHPLSARETQILLLMAEGLSNPEIGARLYVAPNTIRVHVKHVLAKLQARTRAHAVALGYQRGILSADR